eukprot:UN00853
MKNLIFELHRLLFLVVVNHQEESGKIGTTSRENSGGSPVSSANTTFNQYQFSIQAVVDYEVV